MSLRHHFEEDISSLNKDVLKMGLLVEDAMENAIRAFKEKDFDLARFVIDHDYEINEMENSLCDQCALLLAREQPVATDLRHILSAIKIISQLERIGDHAVHIAKRIEWIGAQKTIKTTLVNFPKMEELGREMMIDALNAFVEGNTDLAREVAAKDKEMNLINEKMVRKLLEKMHSNSENIDMGVELLFISRYLERFGDHVTNICEWVIYSQLGEHVDL